MPSLFHRIFVFITLVAFVGCTSLHSVIPEDNDPDTPQKPMNQLMKKNQWVYIVKRDGEKVALKLTYVTDEYLEGVIDSLSAPIRIDNIDIVRVEKRSFDGGKTAFLIIGTTVVLLIAGGMVAGAVAGAAQLSF